MRRWAGEHGAALLVIGLFAGFVVVFLLLSWGMIQGNVVVTMLSGALMAGLIVIAGASLLVPDSSRPQATERTLGMASATLEHMRGGLTPTACRTVCQLLLPETTAQGIAITDAERVLATEGTLGPTVPPAGSPNSWPTKEVLASQRVETFVAMDSESQDYRRLQAATSRDAQLSGIIVPLVVGGESVGAIKLYYRTAAGVDRTQQAIARGLGELISTQLSAYELDRQAERAAQAELRALQAQINPHFLFNSLNTMASLTRTDPAKARDLLREFSAFYRRMLDATDKPITLGEELEQTRRYLRIERARFGEDRIVETEHVAEGCADVKVPSFIVEPVVENAVRHALRDEGALHIDVFVGTEGSDIVVAVADDGNGMDAETVRRLRANVSRAGSRTASGGRAQARPQGRGAGIALQNVANRLRHYFGPTSGIDVVSRLGEGSVVTLRLAGAAPKAHNT